MNNNNRMIRINDEIMREIAGIIRGEMKDPRLGAITTVTKVDTTTDLKLCKVHVSVMGEAEQKEGSLTALNNASGFIRKMLAERINLRHTPELKFILDESLDHSMKIDQILRKINEKEGGI